MIRKLIPRSSYARNVLTLMTGSALAQAIPVAVSPILTRIYSPEEFGRFALFMALTMIISVVVTGRYELAILLPRKDENALHIAVLAIAISIILSAVLLLVVATMGAPIAAMLGDEDLTQWLYLVPVSTLLLGIYQSLNYWSNRKAHYRRLAVSRTLQGGGIAVSQLGGGWVGGGAGGLILGQISGQLAATGLLAKLVWSDDRNTFRKLRPLRSLVLARKYINFPKYLILAHGINSVSGQAAILFLSTLFNTATAGFFTLTQRVILAPMVLVAKAMGDVFRQEASRYYIHEGSCKEIYLKTFRRLVLLSAFPFLVFFYLAPTLFNWVFGDEWRVAGEYAQILTPMAFLQFITSPLSSMYMIAEKQKLDLLWQVALLVMIVFAFLLGYLYKDIRLILKLYAGVYCLMYVINGLISYKLAKGQ